MMIYDTNERRVNAAKLILALMMISGVGPAKIVKFVKSNNFSYERCLSSAPSFFKITNENISSLLDNAETMMLKNHSFGVNVITLFDEEFPTGLFECKQPAVLLYYIGDINLLNSKTITVIGTRRPDQPFVEKGKILVKHLAEMGFTIVSGLAIGCDTIAHESALYNGAPTIAVLPSSCNNVYPSVNKDLAKNIVEKGGLLISEYGCDNKFNKYQLAERDRIQSLLSQKLIIIQATDDGGSMIATKRTIDDGKKAMAIIGNSLAIIGEYIDPDNQIDMAKIDCKLVNQSRFDY